MNAYRQLIIGGYLAELGYRPEPDRLIEGVTPDWFCSSPAPLMVEVFTHYPDQPTFDLLESGEVAWFRDDLNLNRIHATLTEKTVRYEDAAHASFASLVVAVCIEFASALTPEEIALSANEPDGAFAKSSLSGILTYRGLNFQHEFRFFSNPRAARGTQLPTHHTW